MPDLGQNVMGPLTGIRTQVARPKGPGKSVGIMRGINAALEGFGKGFKFGADIKARRQQQELSAAEGERAAGREERRTVTAPGGLESFGIDPGSERFAGDVATARLGMGKEGNWREKVDIARRKYRSGLTGDETRNQRLNDAKADDFGDSMWGSKGQWKQEEEKARVVASLKHTDSIVREAAWTAALFTGTQEELMSWVNDELDPQLVQKYGSEENIPQDVADALRNIVNFQLTRLQAAPISTSGLTQPGIAGIEQVQAGQLSGLTGPR